MCSVLLACACSSDGTNTGAAGATSSAGSTSAGVGGAAAGAATSAGSGGGGTSGASAAGASSAGTAGAQAGTSSGGAGAGGTTAGAGGSAGSSGGSAGAMDCAGHALSLGANGTAAASDAAKARAVIDLMSDLPLGNTSRTVELWAYMKDSDWTGNTNTLFFYGPPNSARNADGFGLDFGNKMGQIGTIDPFTNAIFDNDGQPSGVTTTASQWVHFAMTWNGTAVMAYVNGALKSTKVAPSNSAQKVLMTGSSPFTLGGYPSENAYFAGYIDELRVWNVTRSESDLVQAMHHTLLGTEAGLVGYWKFNETSGTSIADAVTSAGHTAHSGTLMAASAGQVPTFVKPDPPAPVTCP